jgi:hypothetical protein
VQIIDWVCIESSTKLVIHWVWVGMDLGRNKSGFVHTLPSGRLTRSSTEPPLKNASGSEYEKSKILKDLKYFNLLQQERKCTKKNMGNVSSLPLWQ